jgi:hypothetical protein
LGKNQVSNPISGFETKFLEIKFGEIRNFMLSEKVLRTDEQLAKVEYPKSVVTFCPMPHPEFISAVTKALEAGGAKILSRKQGTEGKDERLICVFEVDSADPDYTTILAFRNVVDKSRTLGYYVGLKDRKSGAEVLFAEQPERLRSNHKLVAALPELVKNAVEFAATNAAAASKVLKAWKAQTVSVAQGAELMLRLAADKVFEIDAVPAMFAEFAKQDTGQTVASLHASISGSIGASEHILDACDNLITISKVFLKTNPSTDALPGFGVVWNKLNKEGKPRQAHVRKPKVTAATPAPAPAGANA